MALDKLDCAKVQEKWMKAWADDKIYWFDEKDKERSCFVIDTPPPFPTGEFHTGSTLNWGYIDFAARFRRMNGQNVLFPQGWDCHGFPTEVKVEKKFGKHLPREEFREKCLEFTRGNIASIKEQMNLLGFSIDWRHEYYTLDKDYNRKVQYSLLQMFKDGLVYRKEHPVLFCTFCESAIAKAELEDVERESTLNTIKFTIKETGKELLIATTRPELLHACVAVCVHPEDPRYQGVIGSKAVTPYYGKEVPIVADVDADKEFGTGAVMVCTFGDKQDVVWAYRHSLPIIKACDESGRLLDAKELTGTKIHQAKEEILKKLDALGLVVEKKPTKQVVKTHDRCKKPVELLQSTQWFCKVKGLEDKIKESARTMHWYPPHALQLMDDWVDGLEWDWCISRQRVFGIPIPFWTCEKCGETHAPDEKSLPVDPAADKPPREKCSCGGKLVGEKAICDGWVDSSITPLIITGWPDNKQMFEWLYPTSLRPQGTDIIRTWAFYTIYRCTMLTGKPPFRDMLVNGMVCGSDGKKMSKSLGNYVEAKDVISKTSVDALRQWIALSGSTGKDVIFYWKDVNYAQSFLNKLWNASKFVEGATKDYPEAGEATAADYRFRLPDRWILSRLHALSKKCATAYRNYDYYTAITAIHAFFWHDFCDYYLEDVKHRIYAPKEFGEESKKAAQYCLRQSLLTTLRLLAPIAPYTTEEIYHSLGYAEAEKKKSVHVSGWPAADEALINEEAENYCALLHSVLAQVRKLKAASAMALNEELSSLKITASEQACRELADAQEDIKAVAKSRAVEFSAMPNFEGEPKVEVHK